MGLTPNTSYGYRIKATGADGAAWSATVTGSTPAPLPLPPSNLQASLASVTQVNLTWTDRSSDETTFEIERQVLGGPWTPLASVPANTTSYADTTVVAMHTYLYRVRAVNTAGPSAWWSNVASVDTVVPPAAPTNLQLRTASASQIVMGWTDNSSDEFAFEVWRKSGADSYQRLQSLAPNTTVFIDPNLTPGTTYTYHVRAIGAQGASAWTNEVSWTVP
jgi:titin